MPIWMIFSFSATVVLAIMLGALSLLYYKWQYQPGINQFVQYMHNLRQPLRVIFWGFYKNKRWEPYWNLALGPDEMQRAMRTLWWTRFILLVITFFLSGTGRGVQLMSDPTLPWWNQVTAGLFVLLTLLTIIAGWRFGSDLNRDQGQTTYTSQ